MNKNWLQRNWRKVLLHVFAWLLVFSLPYLLRYSDDDRARNNPQARAFLFISLLTGFFWVISFYVNAYSLTQKFIYRKRYIIYSVLTAAIFFIILFIHSKIFKYFLPARPYSLANSIIFNLPTFLLTVAAGIAYKVLGDKTRSDKLLQAKQEETLKTELSFLRSQISPHFVFNILNNITALARLKSEELEPTIIKLSSLLRYMLYETNEEKVSLQTEIEYLQSYIDLQKQRFGKKLLLDSSLETGNTALEIEPMLLIPFVENAFKHGIGTIADPHIKIKLSISGNTLNFSVTNKFTDDNQEVKDKTSGIGLANVRRRLNLLYGNDQVLLISRSEGWYNVSLQLKLR